MRCSGLLLATIVTCLLPITGALPAAAQTAPAQNAPPDLLQAYIYGYAPVAMAALRVEMTAVHDASRPGRAPINQLARTRALAGAGSHFVPRPNADTLYTLAWLDLAKEPMVLHVPDTAGRYYLVPLYDAYTNQFASIGSRTTGNGAGDFAIVGPRWHGTLPSGVHAVAAPTDMVWLIGRTLVRGRSDLAAALAVTGKFQLVPLSAYEHFAATGSYSPPTVFPVPVPQPDFAGAPVTSSAGFAKPAFFDLLAETAALNPPPAAELERASALVRYGVAHKDELTAAVVSGAEAAMRNQGLTRHTERNGWSIDLKAGDYGTDYLDRALIARVGLGANIAADAVYPSTAADADRHPLDGAKKYVIHFPPGRTPPVKGFWSLTVYDRDGFLVANPIDRYAVGSETGLVANADGSTDILLQSTAPATLETNWLPTPLAPFNLTLRLY